MDDKAVRPKSGKLHNTMKDGTAAPQRKRSGGAPHYSTLHTPHCTVHSPHSPQSTVYTLHSTLFYSTPLRSTPLFLALPFTFYPLTFLSFAFCLLPFYPFTLFTLFTFLSFLPFLPFLPFSTFLPFYLFTLLPFYLLPFYRRKAQLAWKVVLYCSSRASICSHALILLFQTRWIVKTGWRTSISLQPVFKHVWIVVPCLCTSISFQPGFQTRFNYGSMSAYMHPSTAICFKHV